MSVRSYQGMLPTLGPRAYVDEQASVIGDVHLGEDASIWPFAVARGDVHHVRIGARTNVQDGAVLHVTHAGPYTGEGFPLIIGADVTIGHAAVVHACTVHDACLIGMQSTILDGAVIGKHSMIGAGAVVSPGKVVGEGELWLGNPARCVRKLSEAEIERLYYSAQHYVRLKDRYLAETGSRGPSGTYRNPTFQAMNRSSLVPRWLYLAFACVMLALGIIGIVLPGLPTTPFILLAAWAAARGSTRLHRWLIEHRTFGPLIRDWQAQGAVRRGNKWLATITMLACAVILLLTAPRLWMAAT